MNEINGIRNLSQIILSERDQGKAVMGELKDYFQKQYGVIFNYHDGVWMWTVCSANDSLAEYHTRGEGTFWGMLEFCMKYRKDWKGNNEWI